MKESGILRFTTGGVNVNVIFVYETLIILKKVNGKGVKEKQNTYKVINDRWTIIKIK